MPKQHITEESFCAFIEVETGVYLHLFSFCIGALTKSCVIVQFFNLHELDNSLWVEYKTGCEVESVTYCLNIKVSFGLVLTNQNRRTWIVKNSRNCVRVCCSLSCSLLKLLNFFQLVENFCSFNCYFSCMIFAQLRISKNLQEGWTQVCKPPKKVFSVDNYPFVKLVVDHNSDVDFWLYFHGKEYQF